MDPVVDQASLSMFPRSYIQTDFTRDVSCMYLLGPLLALSNTCVKKWIGIQTQLPVGVPFKLGIPLMGGFGLVVWSGGFPFILPKNRTRGSNP